MKKILLTLLSLSFLLGLQAQKHVFLHIVQKAGDSNFEMGNTYSLDAGYDYMPTRLQYYLSLPEIIHDGGQTTIADERYFLVDASEDVILDLGEILVDEIEGIIFSIGVDSARNHLDPANYPADHPLAPQNPSMHWGWVGGYRFIAFEGQTGSTFAHTFEIHSIGDELFKTITLDTDAQPDGDDLIISIQADYNMLLEGIDVSGGLASHGNLGPAGTIMDNIETLVFSGTVTTDVEERLNDGRFSIAPNPTATGYAQVFFELPGSSNYEIRLCDLAGRVLSRQLLQEGHASARLYAPEAGMYLVQLLDKGKLARTEKWVVGR